MSFTQATTQYKSATIAAGPRYAAAPTGFVSSGSYLSGGVQSFGGVQGIRSGGYLQPVPARVSTPSVIAPTMPTITTSLPVRTSFQTAPRVLAKAATVVQQSAESSWKLKLGAEVPNFFCKTTNGDFMFHDFIASGPDYTMLFSHPKDFTPVCTTELGRCEVYSNEFAMRGVQLIGVSCDSVEQHREWSVDILAREQISADQLSFPIIADSSRDIVTTLGMLDPEEKNAEGIALPARALMVIDKSKKIKLAIVYPATTGRNFEELVRVIDSLNLTRDLSLATPADWRQGDRCIVAPNVSTEEAQNRFEDLVIEELPSGKQYLRHVQCPAADSGAETQSSAFVFIKPHAVTEQVMEYTEKRFANEGIQVLSKGAINAEKIDQEMLIDTHYGAIASRAMKTKPCDLAVQQKAQDEFKAAFDISWSDAIAKGQVYNLADASVKLNCSYDEVGTKFDKCQKGKDMIKFGGGFYVGKIDDIYVVNGFYARMRAQFTVPGECIFFYEVQWPTESLCWADFRSKVLGGTDPKSADSDSMRHYIYKNWKDLGLSSEPDVGSNGLHASASPFEAMSERSNWLGDSLENDSFCKAMVAAGVPLASVKEWCSDPAVKFDGRSQSLFDLLEDLDGKQCIAKSAQISMENAN